MESPNQEKIVGRLCAIGRAEYTNLIGGAGYKFVENSGFKWELDPIDLDRYAITMDALLDCVDQLEKMGTIEQLKDKDHFKAGDGWRNTGIVIQSKLDPRIVCSVDLVGNEYDKSDVNMRWYVDVEKESKSAVGAPERMADPEELKAVERAQEMSKEPKSDKKESVDHLFELPIQSAAPTGVKAVNEGVDGWGLPVLGEDNEVHVGVDALEKPNSQMPGKEYGEKGADGKIIKPQDIADNKDPKHVEGDGASDPTLELDLPKNKVKPGSPEKEPALNHMEEAAKLEEANKAAEKKFVELMKKKKAGDKALKDKSSKEIKKMAGLKEDADMSHTGYEREEAAHKHPGERKPHGKKENEDLESDNDGHITQETGEPDQDYEKAELDQIVAALKEAGYEGSHREFDKYQGVHLDVSKDDVSQRFWVSGVDELKDGGCILMFKPEEGGEEAEEISVMVDKDGAAIGDLVDFLEKGKGKKEEPKAESVVIHKGTDENKSAVGIHIVGMKGNVLKEAKEFAVKSGIANIYVHRQAPKFGEKIEARCYISKNEKMLQVEDNDVYVGLKSLEAPKGKEGDKDRGEADGAGVKIKVGAEPKDSNDPKHVDGEGQSQVGGADKEDELAAAKVKPGKPEATPKLMAERKKMREAAMKRREERIAESKKKSKLGEGNKNLSPGHKRLIGEGYDHPHKVVENLKRHMDEAHRAARKAHDMAEHAHKKMAECMESMPHPMASEMQHHHANMEGAKAKLHEGKRMISDVCESVDRMHRSMKRK